MTDEQNTLHNEHAPKVLRLLAQPQIEGRTDMPGTLVILESVIVGALLMAQHLGTSAPHHLDLLYAHVQERLEAEMRNSRS
jgi:hypothetical protein